MHYEEQPIEENSLHENDADEKSEKGHGLVQRLRSLATRIENMMIVFAQQFQSLYTWAHIVLIMLVYVVPLWFDRSTPISPIVWFQVIFAGLGLIAAFLRRKATPNAEHPSAGFWVIMSVGIFCQLWLTAVVLLQDIEVIADQLSKNWWVKVAPDLMVIFTIACAIGWISTWLSARTAWVLSRIPVPWLQLKAHMLYGGIVVCVAVYSVYWLTTLEMRIDDLRLFSVFSFLRIGLPLAAGVLAFINSRGAFEKGWGSIQVLGNQIPIWFALMSPGISAIQEGGDILGGFFDYLAITKEANVIANWLMATIVITFGIDNASQRFHRPLPLPERSTEETGQVKISVQPDPEIYCDYQHYAENLSDFITQSGTGGVLGITGVRGAGKSALLTKVASDLKGRYCVMTMPAPVRHEAEMAFFMTICRNLCTKVIEETERVLTGDFKGEHPAIAEAIRMTRWLILGVFLLTAVFIYTQAYISKETVTPASMSSIEKNGGDTGSLHRDYLSITGAKRYRRVAQHVLISERTLVEDLLQQVEGLLEEAPKDDDLRNHKPPNYTLEIRSSGIGFVLRPNTGSDTNPLSFINPNIKVKLSEHPIMSELLENNGPGSKAIIERLLDDIQLKDIEQGQRKYQVLTYFYHVLDSRLIDCGERFGYWSDRIISSIVAVGGIGSLEQRTSFAHALRLQAQQLKDLIRKETLKDEDRFLRPSFSLPGWTLVGLFLEPMPIIFNHHDVVVLHRILERFRKILEVGPTAKSDRLQEVQGTLRSGNSLLGIVEDLEIAPGVAAGIIIVLLLLALGSYLWNFLNFGMRAMWNPGALALLRESEAFLQLLSYKEESERSSALKFRGFTVGRRQRLLAREMSLSGLTSRFAAFIESVRQLYNGKVVIAIDELDKNSNIKEVKKLLEEVKGALSMRGCFYLMTISEDCAQSFRERLTSGRDIFESSFDGIYHVSRLNKEAVDGMTALWLKDKKEPRLTDENKRLLLLFGGGIAREVVRYFRELYLDPSLNLRSQSTKIANKFLTVEIKEWMQQIAELPISGDTATQLYDAVHKCWDVVRRPQLENQDYERIEELMNQSIIILDPSSCRANIIANGNSTETSRLNENKVRSLLPAIQICLRIKIMVKLTSWVKAGDPRLEEKEEKIIECFRMLPQKTTVAEKLLDELIDDPFTGGNTKILGNRRTKIFHAPGSPIYNRVSPENHVWFESPEEAKANGYRQAKKHH